MTFIVTQDDAMNLGRENGIDEYGVKLFIKNAYKKIRFLQIDAFKIFRFLQIDVENRRF